LREGARQEQEQPNTNQERIVNAKANSQGSQRKRDWDGNILWKAQFGRVCTKNLIQILFGLLQEFTLADNID
jgi:hypothetical protein